ncbi:PepSY domain-containing protein [uncultured Limnobacter sp.]|uniref:PepSY domain-containing protein n=1 Tax=uncultured Limnobacter sp. TaxID=199681 RepID=UPI0030FA654D
MKARAYLLIIAILLLAVPAAHADDDRRIRRLQRSGEILSLETIFAAARSVKPGRIVDVDLDKEDGRYVYEIEVLDAGGRVWEMEFDARTGSLLKLKQDD